jgi:hypothetical protein
MIDFEAEKKKLTRRERASWRAKLFVMKPLSPIFFKFNFQLRKVQKKIEISRKQISRGHKLSEKK